MGQDERPRERVAPPLWVLTYFQPRVVLQLSQKMSATEWSPVSRRRCSAGPQPTLTLSQETQRTRHQWSRSVSSAPKQPKGTSTWRALRPPHGKLGPATLHPCMPTAPGLSSPGQRFQFCPDSPRENQGPSFRTPWQKERQEPKVQGHLLMAHPLSPPWKVARTHVHTYTQRER